MSDVVLLIDAAAVTLGEQSEATYSADHAERIVISLAYLSAARLIVEQAITILCPFED